MRAGRNYRYLQYELDCQPVLILCSRGTSNGSFKSTLEPTNQYIEIYPAVKEDGITNQRMSIHYNRIGAFEVPDERDILL